MKDVMLARLERISHNLIPPLKSSSTSPYQMWQIQRPIIYQGHLCPDDTFIPGRSVEPASSRTGHFFR